MIIEDNIFQFMFITSIGIVIAVPLAYYVVRPIVNNIMDKLGWGPDE